MDSSHQYSIFYQFLQQHRSVVDALLKQDITELPYLESVAQTSETNHPHNSLKAMLTGYLAHETAIGHYPSSFSKHEKVTESILSLLKNPLIPTMRIVPEKLGKPWDPTTSPGTIDRYLQSVGEDFFHLDSLLIEEGQPANPNRKIVAKPGSLGDIETMLNSVRKMISGGNPYRITSVDVLYNWSKLSSWMPDEKLVVYFQKGEDEHRYPFFDSNGREISKELNKVASTLRHPHEVYPFFPFYALEGQVGWAGVGNRRSFSNFVTMRCLALSDFLESHGTVPASEEAFTTNLKYFFSKYGISPDAPHLYLDTHFVS